LFESPGLVCAGLPLSPESNRCAVVGVAVVGQVDVQLIGSVGEEDPEASVFSSTVILRAPSKLPVDGLIFFIREDVPFEGLIDCDERGAIPGLVLDSQILAEVNVAKGPTSTLALLETPLQ